jgi:hypothetical protein
VFQDVEQVAALDVEDDVLEPEWGYVERSRARTISPTRIAAG